MRVTFNSFESNFLPRLQRLNQQQDTANGQIATGQRISVASDDPSAMTRALDYRTEKKQVQQFWHNAVRAQDVSQATFSALDNIRQLNTRAGELAALGSSVASPEQFVAYGSELNELIEQGVNTANSKLGGDYLLGGVKTDVPPFTVTRNGAGQITNVTYQGASQGPEFRIDEAATVSPFTSGTENQQIGNFLNQLVALRDAMQSQNSASVAGVRPGLANSESNLIGSIARAGGVQYRIEVASRQTQQRFESLEGLLSKETDVDYAEAAVRLNKAQTAYEAALQSGARIESHNLLDYLR